jgi:hypothetical protein
MPHGLRRQDISDIQLRCFATQSPAQQRGCRNAAMSKVMLLNDDYVPGFLNFSGPAPQSLSPDGVVAYRITW